MDLVSKAIANWLFGNGILGEWLEGEEVGGANKCFITCERVTCEIQINPVLFTIQGRGQREAFPA
jgi:hypothetical protein